MKEFSKQELAKFDGRNRNPVYFAYNGKVYDVTSSFLWGEGNHQVLHQAGEDLTDAMSQAPHGAEFIEKFPVVGILKDI
jgi:predicted heme/steroid binding protein